MSMSNFNAEVFVSAQIEKNLLNTHMDFGMRIVNECAKLYGFDANEAIRALNIGLLKMDKKPVAKGVSKKEKKALKVKASFPIPFNGKMMEGCCGGLRANRGLYTQCQGKPCSESGFCKGCQAQADKNVNGKPDCGTIADRLAVGLYEFKDPKGKSPIAFTSLLKKLKLSEEAVQEEAGKLKIEIDPEHFEFIAIEKKKGRKSSDKKDKNVDEKKSKGRPKKSKKVLELEGDSSDLFASLVAQANSVSEQVSESEDDSEEMIIEKIEKKSKGSKMSEEEKAQKEAKRQEEKAKKEAEKEAKRLAAEAEKEAKRLAAEAKKEAKRKAAEEEKAKKEAEKKAKEAAKLQKKESPKKETKETKKQENDEPDVVKRIEFEGKKYLKSKKTGIVYNLEQDVVGKWNEETQKIDFNEDDSESEEEEEEGYESE